MEKVFFWKIKVAILVSPSWNVTVYDIVYDITSDICDIALQQRYFLKNISLFFYCLTIENYKVTFFLFSVLNIFSNKENDIPTV